MGGGGKNAASRAAEEARQDEKKRQREIRQGTAAINDTFSQFGPQYSVTGQIGADAAFDPNATYYTANGQVWTPPAAKAGSDPNAQLASMFGGTLPEGISLPGGTAAVDPAEAFRKAAAEGLYTGREQTGDFFQNIENAFVDYARPQVDNQFNDAREQLTYALARNGTLDSSVRGENTADLQRDYDLQLQNVRDQARGYATEARNNVERARADLITNLQVTGDATGAANAALNRASALATPPSYSPLGQLFTDFTAGLAQQAAFERAEAYSGGAIRPRYNTGLFGPSTSATKVTR